VTEIVPVSELYGDESPGRNPSCDTCGGPCGLDGGAYVLLDLVTADVGVYRCELCCRRIRRNDLTRARRERGKAAKAQWDRIGDLWA